MSKNNKKNKNQQNKKHADKPLISASCAPVEELQTESPSELPQNEPLQLKTLIGVLNTDLFDRLFKPAFIAFDRQHNDEPLRQLIESVVTSIALTEDSLQYQKINDISQRYLYYLESSGSASRHSWDAIVSSNLCDYWRSQVFMMLVRNSSEICTLLLPEPLKECAPSYTLRQDDFFNSIQLILNDSIDPVSENSHRVSISELYHFSRGISFPWIDFDTRTIFNIQNTISDEDLKTEHEFAILNHVSVKAIYPLIIKSLNDVLFIDLIYTQYKKLYDDLFNAFAQNEPLPAELIALLSQRIRFDTNYQSGFECISQGKPFSGKLHRASRIALCSLNHFAQINTIFKYAFEHNQGVYLFHYLG